MGLDGEGILGKARRNKLQRWWKKMAMAQEGAEAKKESRCRMMGGENDKEGAESMGGQGGKGDEPLSIRAITRILLRSQDMKSTNSGIWVE